MKANHPHTRKANSRSHPCLSPIPFRVGTAYLLYNFDFQHFPRLIMKRLKRIKTILRTLYLYRLAELFTALVRSALAQTGFAAI